MKLTPKDISRYMRKIQRAGSCVLWIGKRNDDGYGVFTLNGKRVMAHRVSYETFVGRVPKGKQLDHLCRIRHCVVPVHLEPVTCKENLRRGTHVNRNKTRCKNGHPFSGHNLIISSQGTRQCRFCRNAYQRERRAK